MQTRDIQQAERGAYRLTIFTPLQDVEISSAVILPESSRSPLKTHPQNPVHSVRECTVQERVSTPHGESEQSNERNAA